MGNDKVSEVLIADGEYAEAYAPFPGSKEENDEKIKRGILKRRGMKDEDIDRIIDTLEVVPDRGGADGMFDDGPYTPVKLVRVIKEEPDPIPIPIPDPVPEEESTKDPARKPRQTMLQQFYGDRGAELKRTRTFDRFKSHIIKKNIDTYDENGQKRTIEVYTVEDYEGKAKDSDELLLDGYQTRLERLSRAHQRDFSPYERELKKLKASAIKEIMLKYEEMHELNKPEEAEKFKEEAMKKIEEFNSPEFKKAAIQALIDKDTEFIETNNYTYNSRQNTAENLKTLGKDGEKSVKAQISDEQKWYEKFGLKTMNIMIDIRNHTKAPVNKAIGTYVASPIFRALMRVTQAKSKEPVSIDGYLITPMEDILATSQKHSRGMFRNKPSHRYHARKDYFIEEERREIAAKLAEDAKEGKAPKVTIGSLLKLAIAPRVKAITNYREGNTAILNAGLHEIEEATDERNSQMLQKSHSMKSSMRRIASYEKEIEDLKLLVTVIKDSAEKEKIEETIRQRELWKAKLEGRLVETERTEIDSVSTDAVSISQHDKANKANMTTVVRGFKTAARVAAGAYISKYLYEEVIKKGRTPDAKKWIPSQVVEKEVKETITKEVPGIGKEELAELKLGDICPEAAATVTYDAKGGNKLVNNYDEVRGICFEFKGELFSGSDGNGFDPTKLTDVKLDRALDKDADLLPYIQEIMQDKLGRAVSKDEVTQYILSGEITNLKPWLSHTKEGIPMGWWEEGVDKFEKIISSGTHTITEEISKTVTEAIPGRWEIIPGEEYFYKVTQMNPAVLAAELGLAVSEIADLNEFLRFTRSQENIQMRSTRTLMRMAKENEKKETEKSENVEKVTEGKAEEKESKKGKKRFDIKGTRSGEVPKTEIRRNIKSFQRSNKSKSRRYTYSGRGMREATERLAQKREGVTVFERFVGSKRADIKSGYDENALGTNDRFEKPELKGEEVDR